MSQTKKVLKKLNIKLSDFKKNKEELKIKGYTIIRKNKYLKKNLKQINKIIDNLIFFVKSNRGVDLLKYFPYTLIKNKEHGRKRGFRNGQKSLYF